MKHETLRTISGVLLAFAVLGFIQRTGSIISSAIIVSFALGSLGIEAYLWKNKRKK